ncbi:MAG: AI-2E family transporter [Aromatoleum sp.]|uniref:AI-2E family transporter n=1 Tax=Aromatoleum sp. TaxID=2307007 RepID=UPI002893E9C1|nr:AI-2E family transporter [Aromatoleum sp.]MDT3669484.1 AI-2E family transporter [Aromatoleum sp.]
MNDYRKAFVIVVSALFALALYWMLAPFRGALAWGICLAFLLAPVHRGLTRKLKGRSALSAGIITLLVPAVLAGPMVSLGVAFANQVTELVTRLQEEKLRFDVHLLAQLEQYPFVGSFVEWLRQNLTATTEQLQSWLVKGAQLLLQSLAATGGNFVISALGTVVHFFMMLFLLFFLLRDGQQLLDRIVRLVPMEAQRRGDLLRLIASTTRAVVYGTGLTAVAQGTLVGVGFAIAGLPSAVVFGVLAALLALLPVGGAALVWVPGVVALAADSQWGWAIFLSVWGTAVSVSDNLLRPLLISTQAPVSTLVVFVGVVGGVSAFGIIGLIVGPVLLTVLVALLRFVDDTLSHQP